MTLHEALAALRTGWKLIAVSLAICVGAAAYYTSAATPQYAATARLYVAARVTGSSLDQAYTGGLLSQQRISSYAAIVASDPVVEPLVEATGPLASADDIERRISVSSPANTVLLDITFTDPDPVLAQDTATRVAQSFADYANKLETLGGSAPVKVSLVQPAKRPSQPVSPRPKRDVALGVVTGLALGLAAVGLRQALDRSVKTLEDVQALGLPALGAVPDDRGARRHPLLSSDDSQSSRGEAYRQVRTNLIFQNVDEPIRSVVVSSAVAQEGKSSTTANLAFTLAEAGLSVLVVDADLRRPQLANMLGLEGAVGLTDVLVGAVHLDDAIQPWQNGLLAVLPSGTLPLNPSELLNSQRMADLLRELEARFDIVLIDSPPLLPVTDASVLAGTTTGTILVFRAGKSRKEHVRRTIAALELVDAHLIGVVLNRVSRKGVDPYVGYYRELPQRRATEHSRGSHDVRAG